MADIYKTSGHGTMSHLPLDKMWNLKSNIYSISITSPIINMQKNEHSNILKPPYILSSPMRTTENKLI